MKIDDDVEHLLLLLAADLRALVRELFKAGPYPLFLARFAAQMVENRCDETVRICSQSSISECRLVVSVRIDSQSSILETWYDQTMRMVSKSSIMTNPCAWFRNPQF